MDLTKNSQKLIDLANQLFSLLTNHDILLSLVQQLLNIQGLI